jgi:hypothetical protein
VVKPGKLVMVRAAEATAGTAKVSTAGWLVGGRRTPVLCTRSSQLTELGATNVR